MIDKGVFSAVLCNNTNLLDATWVQVTKGEFLKKVAKMPQTLLSYFSSLIILINSLHVHVCVQCNTFRFRVLCMSDLLVYNLGVGLLCEDFNFLAKVLFERFLRILPHNKPSRPKLLFVSYAYVL